MAGLRVVECAQACGAVVAKSFCCLGRAAAHGNDGNDKKQAKTKAIHTGGIQQCTSPGTRRGHGIHIHSAILTILTRGCAERGVLLPAVMAAE